MDAAREKHRADLGKYPTQRYLAKLLGISPKVLCRCIQKIEMRVPSSEKQGARKNHFDQKLFRGLSFIYLAGVREGTLTGIAAANFVDYLFGMLLVLPDFHKINRSCMPFVLDPDDDEEEED